MDEEVEEIMFRAHGALINLKEKNPTSFDAASKRIKKIKANITKNQSSIRNLEGKERASR